MGRRCRHARQCSAAYLDRPDEHWRRAEGRQVARVGRRQAHVPGDGVADPRLGDNIGGVRLGLGLPEAGREGMALPDEAMAAAMIGDLGSRAPRGTA